MIDVTDTKTVDLLSQAKKRGRPVTGRAMTAAQRKRVSRERAREYDADLTTVTVEELLRRVAHYVAGGYDVLCVDVFAELTRRARLVARAKDSVSETVTENAIEQKEVTVTEKPVEVAPVTVTENKEIWPMCATVTKKNDVRYRLGEEVWSGRGKRPHWVADAIAQGMTLMDLLVK